MALSAQALLAGCAQRKKFLFEGIKDVFEIKVFDLYSIKVFDFNSQGAESAPCCASTLRIFNCWYSGGSLGETYPSHSQISNPSCTTPNIISEESPLLSPRNSELGQVPENQLQGLRAPCNTCTQKLQLFKTWQHPA